MAVTVTDRRTIYTQADSTTGWTPGSYGTVSDYAEATLAVGESLGITNDEVYFTGSAINLSNTLVYVYAFNNALLTPWDSSPPPIALLLGDGTDLIAFDMAGSDRRVFNHLDGPTAWQCLVLDGDQADEMNTAGNTYVASGSFAALDLTNIVDVGCAFDTQSKALGGGYNVAVDIIRYGNDGIRITAGGSGTEGYFTEIAVADRSTADQAAHGILRAYTTIAFGVQGPLTFGDDTTATNSYFEDSGVVVVFEDRNISDGKYYFNVEGHASATNSFVLTGSTITTAGPTVKMDFSGGDINTLTFDGMVFAALGGVILFSTNADASGHAVDDSTFDGCGKITAGAVDFTGVSVINSAGTTGAIEAGGGDLLALTVSGYEGTADTSALIYNQATDPDGILDNSSFTKGTAATHAIEFGTSSPLTMTLTDIDFSGYNAADTNTDSTFYVKRTGGTVTINLVGCSGNMTYKSAGATVVLVINPVSLAVHVQDISTGADLVGARVYVLAATTGPLPFEDTVTISRVTTTATVAHTAHGLATNQWVKIEDAVQEDYNGGKQITKIDADSYSYTVANSPTTPATGTILATAIVIFGTTDANGDISDSRSYSSDQDFTGRIRKSSDPYYKTSPLSGTIDSVNGLPLTVGMIPDE